MSLSTGTVLQQRYRIVKEVGRGGFGAVYRAWDLSLAQAVALKENLETGPEASRQFEREARLLAGLRHPNLPRVIDHFVLPNQGQYLIMDFVDGRSLADILTDNGGPLSEAEVLPWIRQVCSALDYLHTNTPPVIHRDIKPHNIIIAHDSRTGSAGRAMLVDFGISKIFDATNLTFTAAKAITPGFSPLEQYGQGTEARSDVYALGATVYALLSGRTPPEAIDIATRKGKLTPLHELNRAVGMTTSHAVMRALTQEVDERPSAAEFERLLSATVPAEPPPKPYQPVPDPLPLGRVGVAEPEGVPYVAPTAEKPARSGRRSCLIWAIILSLVAIGGLIALFILGALLSSLSGY